MTIRYVATALVLTAVLGSGAASAGDVRQQQSESVWHQEDRCYRDAFDKFPDYTAQSNAARERMTRECEIAHHIPVRAPVSESPVKTIPDDAAD